MPVIVFIDEEELMQRTGGMSNSLDTIEREIEAAVSRMTACGSKRGKEEKKGADPRRCECEPCRDDGPHASDCSVHNGPAHPAGPCDCGGHTTTAASKPNKYFVPSVDTDLGRELVDIVNVLRGLNASEEQIRQVVICRGGAGGAS